jgi:hypothetical protein
MTVSAPPDGPVEQWRTGAVVLAAVLLVTAALGLQALRHQVAPAPAGTQDAMYVRSAAAVGRLVLSFDALAADVYWIRAIQHYGGTRLSPIADKSYPWLYPLLDLTTSLDPRFSVPYRFGSIFLAESPPDGPGRSDWSLALLEKGLAANPDSWQLAMDIGFVHYWWRQDYPRAAGWFERAAGMPGGSWWLRSLAATTLAEGGDRRSSRQMWQQIYDTADHAWLRNNARLRLAQLEALDQLDALAGLVARYRAATGVPPRSWQDLVAAGLLRAAPADPSGTPFILDPASPTGASLAPESPLFPLPPQFTRKASSTP